MNSFKWIKPTLLTLIFFTLCACTSKALYDTVQRNQLQECDKLIGSQIEECRALYVKDFETYRKERLEVIKDK